MPSSPPDLNAAASLIDQAQGVIDGAWRELLSRGGVDGNQTLAYDLAHAASALAAARSCLRYGARGDVEARLVVAFLALALGDLATKVLGRESHWGVTRGWFTPFEAFVSNYRDPAFLSSLAESPGPRHLGEDFEMVAQVFHRFAQEQVRPLVCGEAPGKANRQRIWTERFHCRVYFRRRRHT